MKTFKTALTLAFTAAAVVVASACDDHCCRVDAGIDDLSQEDLIALQTLEDQQAPQVAAQLAAEGVSPSPWQGMAGHHHGQEAGLAGEIRQRFQVAREALWAGDRLRAANESGEARRRVGTQVHANRGEMAIMAMTERMEDVALAVMLDPGRVEDATTLSGQLGMLAGAARAAMARGEWARAGALGALGELRIAQCDGTGIGAGTGASLGGGMGGGNGGGFGGGHGNGGGTGMGNGNGHGGGTGLGGGTGGGQGNHHGWAQGGSYENVEILVSLAETAVELATRILQESGADADQESYLAGAAEALVGAQETLTAQDLRTARYLAGVAQWQALKAVVLPGEVTEEEAQAILDLATTLFAQAQDAVGAEPTELHADLLARAEAMIRAGESHLGTSEYAGLGALWRAAVISAWLLG